MNAKIFLGFPRIISLMTGVSHAVVFGNHCELTYADGSKETARITAKLRAEIRNYHAFQAENGPEVKEPNLFEIVQQVQSARTT